ncbi:MAG: Rrf2 family transcriptional regulator [Acidobacteriota bacterium]|nr:Rrf2 family transcriptional regulator [Acidobacteriota bacterium]
MKLSTKSIYALRVLPHLVKAYNKQPLSAYELSEKEDISLKYLEQVLNTLRKNGVIVSMRGKNGGYALRKPPDQISLGDIIRAIDGPLAPIPCASRTAPYMQDDCPYPYDSCWLRHLMLRVRDNISDILDGETLAQMTDVAVNSTKKKINKFKK